MNIKHNKASKIINLILSLNYNKDGIIQTNDQNKSNNLKSINITKIIIYKND